MIRILLLFCLLACSHFSLSQEMLRNGDFELINHCPDKKALWVSKDWKPQNDLSPDLFCNCSDTLIQEKLPVFRTKIKPVSGQCMMGLRMDVYNKNYLEYFYTFLHYKLEAGKKYNFSFYIQQTEHSSYSIQSIGFLFSDKKLTSSFLYQGKERPQLSFSVEDDGFLTCRENWVKFEAVYEATGNEKYLYIGNFNETNSKNISSNDGINLKNNKNNDWKLFSYYVIDSISLSFPEEKKEIDTDTIIETPVVLINENFRFNFKSGSAEIPKESFSILDTLITKLSKLDNYEVHVIGHTDDVGDDDKNLDLSKERAQAVADYLSKNNIFIEQDFIKGKGESEPLCDTFDADCRELNRRVNLIVQSKTK